MVIGSYKKEGSKS